MTTYIGTTGTATIPQIETYTGSTWQTPYGATLVAKADFSAVSSLIVDNVFTSAFDTYYVVLDCTCTVAQSFRFVYRDGSSDVATNYSYAFQYVNSAAGPSRVSGLSQTQMLFAAVGTNTQTVQTITNVAKAAPTSSTFQTASNFGAEVEMAQGGCINTNNTAYEGLKYFVSSGTFTGTIRIYGLRNS